MNPQPASINRREFITVTGLTALSVAASAVLARGRDAVALAERGGEVLLDAGGAAKGGAVLRYYVPLEDRDAHLAELIRTCERVGIREVFLFTTEYLGVSQFKEIGELERICAHLAICAERLKAAGLVFHLNVFHTLGHLYAPQREVEKFGFQRQLQADGQPGPHPGAGLGHRAGDPGDDRWRGRAGDRHPGPRALRRYPQG